MGDTFALDFNSLDYIKIWLKYAQNRLNLSFYQSGEGAPPSRYRLTANSLNSCLSAINKNLSAAYVRNAPNYALCICLPAARRKIN